jgi:hypothetical protein
MKDCYFENLGDDALNMHSTAGTVDEVYPENNAFRCIYGRVNTRLSNLLDENWAQPGDILNIYERESFEHVASVEVVSYIEGEIKYIPIFGKMSIEFGEPYYVETDDFEAEREKLVQKICSKLNPPLKPEERIVAYEDKK